MAKRGLSEKIVYANNPMPIVTDEKLLEMAKLTEFRPATRDPFRIEWKAEAGLDSEWLSLGAGEFKPLREPEARDFIQSSGHKALGMVITESNDPNDLKVMETQLDGLREAAKFFSDAGPKALIDVRKRMGCSKEELETDFRLDFWALFLNQAKATLIKDAVKELGKRIADARRGESAPKSKPRIEAPTGR